MRVTAASRATVGYGDDYECQVLEVVQGTLAESVITLSVLAADADLSTLLASCGADAIELVFARLGGNEPPAIAPVTGFLDSRQPAWQLMCARQPGSAAPVWTGSL